jgi:DNA-binding transcriptional MerR regulator
MTKSADAFRTIREVAEWLDTETHVLRFWESKFSQIKPVKRAGGRRYYRPKDMLIIGGIKKLLHEDGITIKGTQRIIKDKGLSHLSGLSRPLESLEVGKTKFQEKVSRKTKENLSVTTKEEQYTNKFDEVDGQFSMFSNEPLTKPSELIKPEPTYLSISNILYKKTFACSDKVLLKKILSSIDDAIKKRA